MLRQNPAVRDVLPDPIEHQLPLLFNEDVSAGPADWHSNAVRIFYEKNSAALKT